MTGSEGRSAATREGWACGGSGHWQQRADVVVIGTGVAGLAAALAAHRRGRRVVVLSKASETATFYAQGGIAVVVPRTDDSIEAHVADTLAAGGGLCDADAVTSIVADGYSAVAELVEFGARFDELGACTSSTLEHLTGALYFPGVGAMLKLAFIASTAPRLPG